MIFPIIHEDESENEFDIHVCCADCAQQDYGLSAAQFAKLNELANSPEPTKVPSHVNDEKQFIAYIKSL